MILMKAYRAATAVAPTRCMQHPQADMSLLIILHILNLRTKNSVYVTLVTREMYAYKQFTQLTLLDWQQRGFYVSIAALALSFAVYKFSRRSSNDPATAGDPSTQPLITRILQYYSFWQDDFKRRNTLHTQAVEQAGSDRNLFQSSPWTHHIDLKFPE
jgi:hypothetical protein